jgi:DNA-directed RNA polymerase subunit RPC12/RpoP
VARFRQPNVHDYWRTIGAVVLLIGGTVFALTVLRERTPTIVVVLFLLALFWLVVSLFSRKYGYRCAKCKKVFRVPTTVNFFTPSGVSRNPDGTYYAWKSLTCPHCGARTKARTLKKADLRGKETLLNQSRSRR